jgi:hypothetical protein
VRPIPHDPALPNLRELLPWGGAPAVVAEFARAVTGTSHGPDDARLVHVRYRPGRSCRVLWSFPSLARQPVMISATLSVDGRGGRLVAARGF